MNETITKISTTQTYNFSARFILFNSPQVQYTLIVNNKIIGTGIIQTNSSLPIPVMSKGNVTITTFIQSSNVNENVVVAILRNGSAIAVGYNGVNQRNNVTGFVN